MYLRRQLNAFATWLQRRTAPEAASIPQTPSSLPEYGRSSLESRLNVSVLQLGASARPISEPDSGPAIFIKLADSDESMRNTFRLGQSALTQTRSALETASLLGSIRGSVRSDLRLGKESSESGNFNLIEERLRKHIAELLPFQAIRRLSAGELWKKSLSILFSSGALADAVDGLPDYRALAAVAKVGDDLRSLLIKAFALGPQPPVDQPTEQLAQPLELFYSSQLCKEEYDKGVQEVTESIIELLIPDATQVQSADDSPEPTSYSAVSSNHPHDNPSDGDVEHLGHIDQAAEKPRRNRPAGESANPVTGLKSRDHASYRVQPRFDLDSSDSNGADSASGGSDIDGPVYGKAPGGPDSALVYIPSQSIHERKGTVLAVSLPVIDHRAVQADLNLNAWSIEEALSTFAPGGRYWPERDVNLINPPPHPIPTEQERNTGAYKKAKSTRALHTPQPPKELRDILFLRATQFIRSAIQRFISLNSEEKILSSPSAMDARLAHTIWTEVSFRDSEGSVDIPLRAEVARDLWPHLEEFGGKLPFESFVKLVNAHSRFHRFKATAVRPDEVDVRAVGDFTFTVVVISLARLRDEYERLHTRSRVLLLSKVDAFAQNMHTFKIEITSAHVERYHQEVIHQLGSLISVLKGIQ